ncbi:putative ribonuclease H-like domain-containing protein [Tanacetum coccineum]
MVTTRLGVWLGNSGVAGGCNKSVKTDNGKCEVEDRGTGVSEHELINMYWTDANLHVHVEEIKVDKTLRFAKEPVEIIDHEVKSLKCCRIPIVKSIGTRSEDEISLRRGYCDNCALSRDLEAAFEYPGERYDGVEFPDKVYTVEKALYGLHQDPRAWYETLSTYLLENGFRRGTIDKTLFIKKDKDDAQEISDKFYEGAHFLLRVAVQTTRTPIETNKALLKDEEAKDVDVHLYKSMIGSLMYLTACRPDIMFDVCACASFQVTPKVSHLHAVKRIFRYLKGQPKLGLWYPRDSPFDLEAFSDSDYAGASLDRKSTTGGCQFLGKRLISWQCKKQTIVANSTTEAEYVAAANCCRQVLWIQNQMLDYGFNFMNTKIHIDNESTICIVKNPSFYSKTKQIEIRHHFIRDSYEKRHIQVIKIHTDHNVADLLTKAFDVSRTKGNANFHQIVDFLNASTIRKGKSFSGTVTPMFASMSVPQVVEGEGSRQPSEPQPPPSTALSSQEGQDTEIPQSGGPPEKVGDEAVHKELGDRVERAATTAVGLDAEQDNGNILKTQSTAIPNVPLSREIGTDGGHIPRSDEGRLKQDNLTDIVTALSQKVEGLESDLKKTKKLYATTFKKLINRVKSLEDELKFQKSMSKRRSLTLVTSKDEEDLVAEDPSKQGRSLIEEMDLDAGISLVPPHDEVQGRYGQNLET